MTYGQPYVPEPPKNKNNRKLLIALVFLCSAVLLLCCAGAVSGLGDKNKAAGVLTVPAETFATSAQSATTAAPVASPTGHRVVPGDFKLTVKTTRKDCFGSAGCNIEYKIQAAWSVKITEPCDVTYEVKGLEDSQTGTLRVLDDQQFEQDSWQFGSTTSSKKKLSAVATEVECG